ncbi:cell division protein FtsK [Clostridium estertheticum]|uniref:FtsK/SpoIIIE domain-containing protein n=1 Tax=Clostridium estertheticum TaxID=238834 RepID=UPI001CF3E2B5|nr:FtsK/SpoIIIE domain-containing protein [Clostridium estertheticum]MCB2309034.1 cell division protein FtsK [Clostridium estertheticum]MCB2346832.1 cell division protein FtsK [Clostridium estertheticum]MCB2351856.1 cell division protein FtsK [Clostridium estertheticum]WAG48384.1 cell division protein FtsK [Clostridium estertheticum]
MYWELATCTGCIYGISKLYNFQERKVKSDFREMVEKAGLYNNKHQSLRVRKIDTLKYGYKLKVGVPYGIGLEDIEKIKDKLLTNTGAKDLEINRLENKSMIEIMFITKPFKNIQYVPRKLKPYEIYVGYTYSKSVIINMNNFPHVLVGGDTGTGKSRLLLAILTNLIYNSNINIHLLQIRKNDLGVFQNCKQVISYSKTLSDVKNSLQKIDEELQRRELLIDNTNGIYNVEDFNKKSTDKLKYNYIVIEEFSFLNISKGDNKEEKKLKSECLKYIKNLVNTGRSSGMFLITSLQKPTADSIPTDIKAQLTTRISLTIKDTSTSVVIMGDNSATLLKEREFICKTLDTDKGHTFTIEHQNVIDNIENSFIEKKVPEVLPIVENDLNNILSMLNEINK